MKSSREKQFHATSNTSLAIFGASGVIAGLGIGAILLLTLYPFRFEAFERIYDIPRYFGDFSFGGYTRCCTHLAILEPLANVALFLPFSFGITGYLARQYSSWGEIFARVIILSVGLSLSIEILQVFQTWRSASMADLLMNSLGGCVGFLSFRIWHAIRTRFWNAKEASPQAHEKDGPAIDEIEESRESVSNLEDV
jgi:glycopeptide antibiotics resistance protein